MRIDYENEKIGKCKENWIELMTRKRETTRSKKKKRRLKRIRERRQGSGGKKKDDKMEIRETRGSRKEMITGTKKRRGHKDENCRKG